MSPDMNGSAPDQHPVALLLIDVINDFEYPRGEELLGFSMKMAPCIRKLKRAARERGIPAIYVNDNFGRWQSSFEQLLAHCLKPEVRGHAFVEQVQPDEHDYFVLKPKHSGFYQTPLDILLKHLGAKRVILAGIATNSCVFFTANDAYMRDFELTIPRDCVAAYSQEEQDEAIAQMESILKARTAPVAEVDFAALVE